MLEQVREIVEFQNDCGQRSQGAAAHAYWGRRAQVTIAFEAHDRRAIVCRG